MAELRAFRGIRFTPASGPLSSLTAPPYDVIGEEQRKQLALRNPRNIVHLILPQGAGERYRLAAEKLEMWTREGHLAQERDPALYLYRQTFNGLDGRSHVRTGFLGLLKIEPIGGSVRHHEQTLAKPLEDRLRLIRATHTQLSPIFVLYSDPGGRALKGLEGCSMKEKPGPRSLANAAYGRRANDLTPGAVQEFNDDEGVRHWLQPISDELAISEARKTLSTLPVVIADGHHRYSAALEYLERMQKAFPDDDRELPENYVLACFVRAEDPGLIVRPTHRVIPAGPGEKSFDGAALLSSLADRFEIQSLDVPVSSFASGGSALRADAARRVMIGASFAGDPRLHVLLLHEGDAPFARHHAAPPLRQLDVAVLHSLILEPELGIGEAELKSGGRLHYERDAERAAALVAKGEAKAAFFLRPIATSSVFDVTAHGLLLPQKSTYFAPKLASGLVMHRLGV